MQTIGLFGGSFDPVHLGHLLVAQAAVEEAGLNRIFFIPTTRSPFKPEREPLNSQERLRLLRLSLAGRSDSEVDDQEIRRGGVSYTIDTVRSYRQRFPEARIFYLIGADHLPQLPAWRESGELARLVEFLVIPRPGQDQGLLPPPFRGQFLKGFPFAVSSSEVRSRIRQGKTIRCLVPDAVEEAIVKSRLYL